MTAIGFFLGYILGMGTMAIFMGIKYGDIIRLFNNAEEGE